MQGQWPSLEWDAHRHGRHLGVEGTVVLHSRHARVGPSILFPGAVRLLLPHPLTLLHTPVSVSVRVRVSGCYIDQVAADPFRRGMMAESTPLRRTPGML